MVSPEDGYEIREGDGFLTSVREILGAVAQWDDIWWGIDWALSRDPMNPEVSVHLVGNLWFTLVDATVEAFRRTPALMVFYEVNEADHVVTLVQLTIEP